MATSKRISLKLSPEQQKQIKQATGKDAGALELTVEELEERIAPVAFNEILITKPIDKPSSGLY